MQTEAWRWQAPGAPEQLQRAALEVPPLDEFEVLVENRVIAFNPVDWKLIASGHAAWQPGQVPGVDGMGVVVAVGSGVHHWRIGSRVAYHTDLRQHGSFARHTSVPARALLAVPEHLSDEAAAAFPCPGLTAWQAQAKLPDLRGESVLINGAGSNVGRFAVCLSLTAGMRVFASAGSGHHDWLRQRGAQAAIDYRAPDWLERLRVANGGEPFSAAIDLVSEEAARTLIPHLGYYGHLVSVLGRIECNPLPAFTHCLSLHEIALGAQHAYGADRQWQVLVKAGERMMQQLVTGELPLPPMRLGHFDELPQRLGEFRREGQGFKYLLRI
ncbi:MAG TPA: alcohol dehydrogenase catalytic domain-containing protein [Acetobacteraceae bacterium]|nr:alcohol dehydrogenase catalytic domain-containing protein [Acetobacteraceae bacterium]